MTVPKLQPGFRVRVMQEILTRESPWRTEVEGRIISVARAPTGSWFAHGKNDKLWLQRLQLQKDDGEIVDLVLGRESVVTILETAGKAD